MLGFGAYAQYKQAPKTRDMVAATKDAGDALWFGTNTPFTTYDFRDTDHANPLSLQAWMDSGYCVVVDFSAAWCGPCWAIHEAGILEGFYDRFGPEGTNQVRVLWVEGEETNTADQITGTTTAQTYAGYTQGDWTKGGTVPFPMADDATIMETSFSTFWNMWMAYPCIVMATPEGFYTPIYGVGYGITTTDTSVCNNNLLQLMNNRPRAGYAPSVYISGPTTVMVGQEASYSAIVVSVDSLTNVNWSFDGGNPASVNSENATTVFNTEGDHTVTFTATNANGTTTRTLTVNAFSWNWGATMTYVLNDEMETTVGAGGSVYWAAMYPAQFMTGRQYLKSVDFYLANPGTYQLHVYEGGDDAPENEIYNATKTYSSNTAEGWQNIQMNGAVPLSGENLWVVFYNSGVSYPAAGAEFSGDYNGSWVSLDGNEWDDIESASSGQLSYTWMIKATTGNEPNVGISEVLGSELSIYPNPTTGKVSIDVENFTSAEVMDITGRTVMTSNESTIDMSNLNNGVYMIRVNTANGSATQKIVKR